MTFLLFYFSKSAPIMGCKKDKQAPKEKKMDQYSINKKKLLILIQELFSAANSCLDEQDNYLQDLDLYGFPQKNRRRIRDIIFEELGNDLQKDKLDKDIPNIFPAGNNVILFPRNNIIPFRQN